jgi:hypothetical protein
MVVFKPFGRLFTFNLFYFSISKIAFSQISSFYQRCKALYEYADKKASLAKKALSF